MFPKVRRQPYKLHLDGLLRAEAGLISESLRPQFWRLVHRVRMCTQLLDPQPGSHSHWHRDLIKSLAKVAEHSTAWTRSPESLSRQSGSSAQQFRQLVAHLFERYPVPNFMARVWLDVMGQHWQVELYLHLAQGLSIRQFRMPEEITVRLTKSAASWFMQGPDDLRPVAAMRWAQVRSLGGDSQLARCLATCTHLSRCTSDEHFWQSVIRFLVRYPSISDEEVISIIEFIEQQRFVPASEVMNDYMWDQYIGDQPLQPNFTLQGRTLRSLRRHMSHWMSELASTRNLPTLKSRRGWRQSTIAPWKWQEGDVVWMIEELHDRESLVIEGRIMRHCVASYCHACFQGRASIWSLRACIDGRIKRVLTIEVAPRTKIIRQAKGYRNAIADPDVRRILRLWAEQECLTLNRQI